MVKRAERRKHKRVKQLFMLKYKTGGKIKDKKTGWKLAAVIDIGAGGTLFYTNERVRQGSDIDIKIELGGENGTVRCSGKVLRVEELKNHGIFFVACVFEKLSEKVRKSLISMAEKRKSK